MSHQDRKLPKIDCFGLKMSVLSNTRSCHNFDLGNRFSRLHRYIKPFKIVFYLFFFMLKPFIDLIPMQIADLQTIFKPEPCSVFIPQQQAAKHLSDPAHSSSLPPNPPNPACPSSHILPLHQALNREPVLGQLLITRTLMHKPMTSPTQPCHTI